MRDACQCRRSVRSGFVTYHLPAGVGESPGSTLGRCAVSAASRSATALLSSLNFGLALHRLDLLVGRHPLISQRNILQVERPFNLSVDLTESDVESPLPFLHVSVVGNDGGVNNIKVVDGRLCRPLNAPRASMRKARGC